MQREVSVPLLAGPEPSVDPPSSLAEAFRTFLVELAYCPTLAQHPENRHANSAITIIRQL